MGKARTIAGACFSAALLTGCGGHGTSVFPATTTTTSLAPATTAFTEKVLYRFKGSPRRDGQVPLAGLIAVNGTFYGTTAEGGGAKACRRPDKYGTVYRVSTAGREEVVYSFKGAPDGDAPAANLLPYNGLLYGTTTGGGENNAGTVFAIDPGTGTESVVYSFKGRQDAGDGASPRADLIAVHGVLYGTTSEGGGAKCESSAHGCGTVFKLTTSGTEQVIHVFEGDGRNRDGAIPYAGLTAANGLLYGTTIAGGHYSASCQQGCGTVFAMGLSGEGYRSLYRFKGGNDGVEPNASLVNVNGKFYGTTNGGGGSTCDATGFGCGTVFEVSASGRERIVKRFKGESDGAGPNSLIAAGDTLYGTTLAGGAFGCMGYGCGSVFEISTSGNDYAVLHGFRGPPDGLEPAGTLLDQDGTLYGTTPSGGRKGRCYGCFGTVFKLTL